MRGDRNIWEVQFEIGETGGWSGQVSHANCEPRLVRVTSIFLAFKKIALTKGSRIGFGDVANIFQSIWAKLRHAATAGENACHLPPFEGRLGRGMRSLCSRSTDVEFKWYVQQKQGDDFLKLSLKRSEFFCSNFYDVWCDGHNAPISTSFDETFEPGQSKECGYNLLEAVKFFSGQRDDPPVDDRWSNNTSSIVRESSQKAPPPYPPTTELHNQPVSFQEHGSPIDLPTITAHDDFMIDHAQLLHETSSRSIYLDVPEYREGRYWDSNQAGISAEEAPGYENQPRVRMPRAQYSRLDFYSGHRDQHLTCAQGGHEPSVVKTSENNSHQSLFDQSFQSQEMAFGDPLGYQTEITGFHSQAVHSPSLVALLDSEKPEHEAGHSSNSRLGQDSPQSSQHIYQDTSCASSSVFGLAHDQSHGLANDESGVLLL